MKYSLLPYTHILNVDWIDYKFKDPFIYDYLLFEEMVWNKEYMKAILKIAPCFNKMDIKKFSLSIIQILEWIITLLSTTNERISPNKSDWFFIATVDFFSERYWLHPNVFIKTTRMHQMKAYWKGIEWNINIQNDALDKNRNIIQEQEDQNDLLEQVRAMKNK